MSASHGPRRRVVITAPAMPPGPQMRASLAVAAGARALGLHPFPFPLVANSASGHNGQHACNNCGFCSSFGGPVVARPPALVPLRQALRTGRVGLVPETMVTKVLLRTSGAISRATGVHWTKMTERGSVTGTTTADVVVLAASAIETVLRGRLAGGRAGVARVTWSAGKHEQWHSSSGSLTLRLAGPSA